MQEKQPLSTSQFYMWRSLLGIAWADGLCGVEETAHFAKVFDTLPRYYLLTAEQRNALADDLEHAKKPEDFFPFINDPETRGMLLSFAEDLVMIDGVLDPREDDIIKKLRLGRPGRDELRTEVQAFLTHRRQDNAAEWQAAREHARSLNPLSRSINRLLAQLGIDLAREKYYSKVSRKGGRVV